MVVSTQEGMDENISLLEASTQGVKTKGKSCTHIAKSISLANIKRKLQTSHVGTCDKKTPKPCSQTAPDSTQQCQGFELPVWFCLQCGHQGCDVHSESHVITPRSDSHALAVDVTSWTVRCYTCQQEVPMTNNKKLHETVQFIRKRHGALPPKASGKPDKLTENESESQTKGVKLKEMPPLAKVKGLNNLGNTCYMNAVLQCLSQCHYFTHYMELNSRDGRDVTLQDSDGEDVNFTLAEGGPLTSAVCVFLKQMHNNTAATVNPSPILTQITQKAVQFTGYDQQDSQELLRTLMECLRQEDVKRYQVEILKKFGFSRKVNPSSVEDDKKRQMKHLGRQAAHGTVDSIFAGQLISIVVCQSCHFMSYHCEPFLDLSLPVAEEKPGRPKKPSGSAEDDGDEGVYALKQHNGNGQASDKFKKVRQKKNRGAKRRAQKGNGSALNSELGGETAASVESESQSRDGDVEDNLDCGDQLLIGSLLSDVEEPQSPCHASGTTQHPLSSLTPDTTHHPLSSLTPDTTQHPLFSPTPDTTQHLLSSPTPDTTHHPLPSPTPDTTHHLLSSPTPDTTQHLLSSPTPDTTQHPLSSPVAVRFSADTTLCSSDPPNGRVCQQSALVGGCCVQPPSLDLSCFHLVNGAVSMSGDTQPVKGMAHSPPPGGAEDAELAERTLRQLCLKDTSDGAVVNTINGHGRPHSPGRTRAVYLMDAEPCDAVSDKSTCSESYAMPATPQSADRPTNGRADTNGVRHDSDGVRHDSDGVRHDSDGVRHDSDGVRHDSDGVRHDTNGVRHDSDANTSGVEQNGTQSSALSDEPSARPQSRRARASPPPVGTQHTTDIFSRDSPPSVGTQHTTDMFSRDSPPPVGTQHTTDIFSRDSPPSGGAENGHEAAASADSIKCNGSDAGAAAAGEEALLRRQWLDRALVPLAPRYQPTTGECSLLTSLNQFTSPELLSGSNRFACSSCTELRDRQRAASPAIVNSDEEAVGGSTGGMVYSSASKQLMIYSPPPVLTLHLKRFEICGDSLRKVNKHVQFDVILDLASYCSSIGQDLSQMHAGQSRLQYSLFAVVEHCGRIHSGHYTAYVRSRPQCQQRTANPQFLTRHVPCPYQLARQQLQKPSCPPAEQLQSSPDPLPDRWFHVSDAHVQEVTLERVLKCQAYLIFYERIV